MADIYKVQNEKGDIVEFEWDGPTPPTDEDMEFVFAEATKFKPAVEPVKLEGPSFEVPENFKEGLLDAGTGEGGGENNIVPWSKALAKGAAHAVISTAPAMVNAVVRQFADRAKSMQEDELSIEGTDKTVEAPEFTKKFLTNLSENMKVGVDTWKDLGRPLELSPDATKGEKRAFGVGESLGLVGAALPFGAVGGPVALGVGTSAQKYDELVDAGVEPERAHRAAIIAGIAETVPELFSFKIGLSKNLPFVKKLIYGQVSELLGESATTATQLGADLWALNPNKSKDEIAKMYGEQIGEALQETAIQTLIQGPIQSAGMHTVSKWSTKLDQIVNKYKKPTEVKETPKTEPVAKAAEVPAEEKIPTIEDANREVVIRDMKKEGIEPSDEQSPKLGKFRLADPGIKGWNRGEAHKEYVGNLIQWAKKTGKKVASGHVDFGNLKGLNQKFGHEEADKHFQAGMDIVRTTIEEAFPDKKKELSRSHAQGDEFHIEVIDVDHKDLLNVLETAKKRIEEYAEKNGIKELPADGKMKPVTLHYTAGDISEFATIDDFFKGIDAKRVVKEVTDELRRGSKKTGTVTPKGQAAGAKKRSVKGPKAAPAKVSTVEAGEEVDKSMSLEAYANRSTKMTDGLSYEEWKATQEADEASTLEKLAGKETTPPESKSAALENRVNSLADEFAKFGNSKEYIKDKVAKTGKDRDTVINDISNERKVLAKELRDSVEEGDILIVGDEEYYVMKNTNGRMEAVGEDNSFGLEVDSSLPFVDTVIVNGEKLAIRKKGEAPVKEKPQAEPKKAEPAAVAQTMPEAESKATTVEPAVTEPVAGEETLEDLLEEVPSEEELLAEQEKISAPAEGTVDQEELDLVALEMFQEEYEELSAEDKAAVDAKVKGVVTPEPAAPVVKEKEEKPDLTKGKFIAPKPFEEGIVNEPVEKMEEEVKELNEKIQAQRAKLDKNETEVEDIDEDAVFKAIDKLEERLRLLHKSIAVAKGVAKPTILYSGIPVDALVDSLRKLSPHVVEAKERVVELGKRIYAEGHTSYEAFSKRMQSVLKDAWEKFKSFIQSIWNEVRRSQRGAVGDLRPVDPFYSQLEKTVKEKVPNKAEAYIIKRILENPQNAVRKAELEDSGILTWLEGKKGQVSKEEVLKFIKENSVQIIEVVKGSKPSQIKDLQAVADELYDYFRPDDFMHSRIGYSSIENMVTGLANGEERAWGNLESSGYPGEKIEKLREQWLGEGTTSKYSQHTLPGGENYREILFTLPTAKGSDTPVNNLRRAHVEIQDIWVRHEGLLSIPELDELARGVLKKYDIPDDVYEEYARTGVLPHEKDVYKTSHWTEPNVLAHVRINDRTDSKGKKVLFIEEVQSDWHQTGRREGYTGQKPVLEDGVKKLTGVPDAPFKKNWHEFVLKRMIRYASENGYDKVAWTTGEQQADRYDLSRQVEEIEVLEKEDGKYMVTAKPKDSNRMIDVADDISADKLADYIGKDQAKTALTRLRDNPYQTAVLSGIDLKVGGEGMKGFYDKIIPDFVRGYTKKWGGVVEDVKMPYAASTGTSIGDMSLEKYGTRHPREDQLAVLIEGYERWKADKKDYIVAHSVSITPAMHSAVMYKGQTLYSFPAGAFSEAAKAAKWAAEKVKELKERTDDPDNLDLAGHLRSVDKNKLWQGVKEEMDRSVGVISTRLKNINPIIRDAARRYVYNVGKNTTRDNTAILEFVKKFGKLSDKDKITFSRALLNSHRAPADAMADMFGMKAELKAAREVLDSLYERAVHAGHNIGRLLDYWPRVVKDPEGLLSDLQGTKEWSAIQYAIDKKRRETGQDLSDVEKAQIADSILRGYGAGQIQLGGTAHAKKREITTIPDRLLKYYSSADQSIISYIHSMNNAIEAANFFGKGKYSQPDLKLGLDLGLITESDLTWSIGDYVVKLREENAIDGKDERRLKEMLQAMFMPARTGYGVHLYKNLTYLQLLAQFTPAITQIVDLALAAEQVGYINTAVAAGKSLVGKSTIRVADVGIDRAIYEFDGTIGAASRLLEKGLKYTGFEFFDRLGKETLLNGKLAQMKRQASERDEKLVSEIARIFGPEQVDSVIDQLKNGEKTDDTLFLLYNHLSDVQPISRIEVPERYLRSNVGKVFYALKTYQIKLLDIYRNEVYNEWKSGNRVDAVRKLTTMTAALVALGVGTDELKDWLLRKKGLTLKERVLDNLWRIAGLNKYMANRLDEGLGAAVFSQTAPPLGVADAAVRDMAELARTGELKFGSRSAAYIPIGGKMYYWWFGRGANIKEEFGEPNTEAERKLRDYAINSRRKKPSEMSEEQQRNRTMIAEVKRRYKTGELKTVGEVAKAIKENKITLTDADKKDLIMAKKTGEVAERYKREKLIAHRTVFEVMNTWKVMTDQEKLDYSPLILKKIKNSKSMSMEEKKQAWRTIRAFRKSKGLSSSVNDDTNSSDPE